jgi:hypothetical protein
MEELRFKYSGLFQNVDIRIFQSAENGSRYTITAEADIKLPIMKKTYQVSTEFDGDRWIAQTPPYEKGSKPWRVERKDSMGDAKAPAEFFMDIHMGEYNEPTVKLAIGDKIVELDVIKLRDGYEVKRRDKDQKLILRKDARGISALEVPLPIIGNLVVKRV